MKNVMKYKGFLARVHYSAEEDVFFGKIEGITDLITFEGQSTSTLKNAFHEAVDDYIALCEAQGKPPVKSYRGSFNVRVTPELHRRMSETAILRGVSLNQLVQTALEHELSNS